MHAVVSIGACSIGFVFVYAFDDVVCAGERFLDVAEAHAPAPMTFVHERVVAPVRHDRGARLEGLLDVEHGRQLLEVQPDLRDGLHCRLLGLGHDRDDRGDRLALVTDAILGQDELLLRLHPDEPEDRIHVVRHVCMRDRADEPRDTLRFRQVDAPDPGVVDRAAHDLEVEHSRKRVVGRVLRPARDVTEAITSGDRPAHDVQRRAHHDCAPLLAIARAALSTASMIGA